MLNRLKGIFSQEKDSKEITDFSDAVSWIKTYRKAEDFDVALFAWRELMLKTKSGINYYEEVLKKLMFLEASNIDKVSKAAREKSKKANAHLSTLYKRFRLLEGIIHDIEEDRRKQETVKQQKIHEAAVQKWIETVQIYLKKKEYDRAVAFAKKLVAEFPNERKATNLLAKVQKIHNGQKTKEQKQEEKHEKISKILKEVGFETNELKKEKGTSPITKLRFFWNQMRLKDMEKKEYVMRQKALKSIEQLLIKSGTIDNIGEENKNEELFSIMTNGLSKDIDNFSIHGFDFYGKILWKDKIVGDTFGFYKEGNKTVFYLGDATGHGVQSWFTVALLSKLFFESTRKYKNITELFCGLNNQLKEKIRGRFFVTSIFFELDNSTNQLNFIGAWHDPMFVYRKSEDRVERIIPGGLALWVRIIQNISSVKIRELKLENGDVLFAYTDGIIEIKDEIGEMYSLNRLEASFKKHAKRYGHVPERLYEEIMKDTNDFKWSRPFEDDVSAFIFTRNTAKDIIGNRAELESILKEMDIKKDTKEVNFKNKTRQQIIDEMKKERYDRDVKIRLDRLDRLYKMGEFTKLKMEVSLYFREGFVHEKMKFYLEKALENEQKTILKKQEERLQRKYETLQELYRKGEYELVVKEVIDILFKNGKI